MGRCFVGGVCVLLFLVGAVGVLAQAAPDAPAPVSAASVSSAGNFGIAVKRPVLGAACPGCPWGALADKVKAAMKPAGFDVQICYNCSGPDSVRIVDERRRPLPLTPQQMRDRPAPPNAPVDFGVVNLDFFTDAYRGIGRYRGEPHANLRLIARVEDPQYYFVATRTEAFITDLRQIKEKHLPVRMVLDDSIRAQMILDYYGLTRQQIIAWGGSINATESGREAVDVVISFANSLNNTPESNIWYELSQKLNLRYLQLPDDLIEAMAKASDWEVGDAPVELLRGMEKPIRTIMTSGTVIYGRADLSDQFAYDVAKALDEQKHLLIYSMIPFSYNPDLVWQARGVPVHPGAARYYREKGYMKAAFGAP